MTYRDDLDAAHSRIHALEQDKAELAAKLDEHYAFLKRAVPIESSAARS